MQSFELSEPFGFFSVAILFVAQLGPSRLPTPAENDFYPVLKLRPRLF